MTCFIIMPFNKLFNGIWESILFPTVEEFGHSCIRADNIFAPGSIIQDVIDSIEKSDYIIADVSIQNANVYYELGYAQALNKKVILISRDLTALPFDIKSQRVISYEDTAAGAQLLRTTLKTYIENIKNER